jgi:RHS repeat-associated protein
VTGTAVTAEYHDYTVNDGTVAAYEAGSITETVHYGTSDGAHWRKTTTNFLGQVLREEEPSPAAGGGVIATTHVYNAKGQRVRTSRTGTVDLRFEYDDFGRMVKQGYDVNSDNALTVASADVLTEVQTSYEDQDGLWVEKTLQRTHTQPNGQLPLEVVTRRSLREGSTWQSTTGADGSVTVYQDWTSAAGHLHGTQVLRSADGTSLPVLVQSSVSYNGLQVAQSVPGAGTPVLLGYNGFGQMTSQTHPVAGTSEWAYNAVSGQLESQTPAGGSAVSYTYYPASHANAGQVASVTANGQVTRYAYDAQGRQTHQWGTGAQPLKYVYDDLGRLHELHTYQGGSGWDSAALPAAFESATAAVTRWDYREGTSALWKKTDATNRSVVYAYGADGMRSTKTNARNITTTYAYETVGTNKLPGRLTGLTYSDDTPDVVMTYKRSGELATVSDAAGLSTFTGSAPTRTVTVTGNGLMSGLVVGRTERGPDQPETVLAQVGGVTVVSNQHAWTDAGLLHQAWQGVRDTGFGGNGLRQTWNRAAATGRLESVTSAAFGSGATHGVARGYTHSAGGRIEKLWYNAGPVAAVNSSVQGFDYDHDTHGRREVVRPWLPDSTPTAAEQPPGWKYGYNERGEVEVADRFTAEAGPETGIVGHQRRSYAYDMMGNRDTATQGTAAAELRQTGYSANILQQYDGLTHSRSVEITGQAVAGATVELTLDAGTPLTVDRSLPQHQTGDPHSFRYVHTVAGTEARWLHVQIQASAGGINLTRQGFVYVPPASETVVHDNDGNLTEDAQWEYTWDAENRMTSATQKLLPVAAGVSTPPPARKQLTFAYDYRNRRIAKAVHQWNETTGQFSTPIKDVRFVHDGYQMIAELDHTFATGTGLAGSRVNRTFLWGPDVSGTMSGAGGVGGLISATYQGVSYQVCSDANGNVTGLVPTSGPGAGTLVARFDYDPFGNRITNTGPDVELCPFGFSTKYTDTETGIVNYELRPYQPPTGRFMCGDPIGERGGINLYGFVGNDAVNRWDYLGLTPDINVTLTRDSTGYINTYGSIKVTINNQGVTICCAPKKTEWKTLELPVGNYALQIGESEDNRRSAEDRPFRSLGPHTNSSLQNAVKTSPRALAIIYGAMVPEMKPEMNPDDYNNAISKAFNVFANINVHAGPGSWDSLFCPIIGNVYVPVPLRQMSEKRHHYPNVPDEPDGHRYIVHGFEINDSLRAQMEFNMIFACAERSLGRKPKVSFKVINSAAPLPFKGIINPPVPRP